MSWNGKCIQIYNVRLVCLCVCTMLKMNNCSADYNLSDCSSFSIFSKKNCNRFYCRSERELGVLWAMEGSILLLVSLLVVVFSHRPLVLGALTLLTVLYSLHKCDDSLKELASLLLRALRWADSRFFAARCFARRQWRKWRLSDRPVPTVAAPGPPAPALERRPVCLAAASPRMGPTQLFSTSSLALTDPRRRRFGLAAGMRSVRPNDVVPASEPTRAESRSWWKYGESPTGKGAVVSSALLWLLLFWDKSEAAMGFLFCKDFGQLATLRLWIFIFHSLLFLWQIFSWFFECSV